MHTIARLSFPVIFHWRSPVHAQPPQPSNSRDSEGFLSPRVEYPLFTQYVVGRCLGKAAMGDRKRLPHWGVKCSTRGWIPQETCQSDLVNDHKMRLMVGCEMDNWEVGIPEGFGPDGEGLSQVIFDD
jgi:hypothetical protein